MTESAKTQEQPFRIWVDGDACPVAIKEILFRTAKRLEVHLVLVANAGMHCPKSKWTTLKIVPHGADAADNWIVDVMSPGDLVITGDIPLASRVVQKEGTAIGTRGEIFDDSSVHERLATRNLMEEFRSAGVETKGPRPLNSKDVQAFANSLDRWLVRRLRGKRG